MKALQLKTYGELIAEGQTYLIYKYQELNDRKRFFHYLVELRGVRFCLIRRLNESELIQYQNIIVRQNEQKEKENARFRNKNHTNS